MNLNPLSDAHVEILSLETLIDHIDALAKFLVKRVLRDLLIGLLFSPFVFLLILVLYFDLWLIVTGSYR